MTIFERLQELILDFEDEIKNKSISLPPGLLEIIDTSNQQILFHLQSALNIFSATTEQYISYVIQNLDFIQQRQVYDDLAIYIEEIKTDPSTAFNNLRSKTHNYNQMQKFLVSHEFKKINQNGK